MFSKFNTAAKSPADQTSRKLQQVAKANKSNTVSQTTLTSLEWENLGEEGV
jgi:hypothetical protein